MGEIGDPRAVDPLCTALYDDKIAPRAGEALVKIGDPRAAKSFQLLLHIYLLHEQHIGRTVTLRDVRRYGCFQWLVQLGDTAVPFLVEELDRIKEVHRQ